MKALVKRKILRVIISATYSRKEYMSTDRALKPTGLWRDLVNAWELKARKADGSFA